MTAASQTPSFHGVQYLSLEAYVRGWNQGYHVGVSTKPSDWHLLAIRGKNLYWNNSSEMQASKQILHY